MKNLTLLLIISIVLTAGCGKGPVVKTETPAKTTISTGLVVDSVTSYGSGSYEFGNKFYSSKNGKITKLGCRMPEIGSYRVSLWDFATTNLITATTISVTDTSQFKYNDISAVDITANTRYVISINNTVGVGFKKYFIFYKKPALNVSIYPFTTGSITFESFQEKASNISIFPNVVVPLDQKVFAGVPDMYIEYTE